MRLFATLFLMGYIGSLNAEPKFQANVEGVRIVLHSDKCELTAQITNLPFKAEWFQDGKVLQGCWKPPHPEVGTVDFYFADKTSFGMPAQIFKKVVGV
jgi:hypothetical protein